VVRPARRIAFIDGIDFPARRRIVTRRRANPSARPDGSCVHVTLWQLVGTLTDTMRDQLGIGPLDEAWGLPRSRLKAGEFQGKLRRSETIGDASAGSRRCAAAAAFVNGGLF